MFYADILTKMGKPDQAIKHYEYVLTLEPNNPKVLYEMSQAARMIGQTDKVQEINKDFKEEDLLNANVIYSEANNRKNTVEECNALEDRITRALAAGPAHDAVSNLNYSRGKIWSDVGDYDRAFAAYKTANECRELKDDQDDPNITKNMRNTFTKQFFKLREKYGNPSNAPIFIFGMPRSGTTLTESICGAHSKVTAGDELSHIADLSLKLGEKSDFFDAYKSTIEKLSEKESQMLGNTYLKKSSQLRTKTPHSTDKMPHNFRQLGFIRFILPNAPLIHCRRHPVDNCVSLFTNAMNDFHCHYKSDLKKLGLYYRQYWQHMQFWRENIPGGFLEVFYEDMVANTELNARKMIEYIGLDWEDDVMDRQKSQKSVKTLSAWQVRQPVYTSSAGRWKKYEKHLGPLIDGLGPVVEEYEEQLKALSS
jgi:tetratricopeptide (TPR) repeat protein